MRMSLRKRLPIFWLICVLSLAGCPSKPSRTPAERTLVEQVPPGRLPDFRDDGTSGSLRSAMEESLFWYAKIAGDRQLSIGRMKVPARVVRESLEHFASLVDSGRLDADRLARDFDIFRIVPPGNSGGMLVTGYYEPVLDGSLRPGGEFRWPIYPVPPDLLVVKLGRFGNEFRGVRLVGRLEKNFLVPYYSRSEIDGEKILENRPHPVKPLVWLKDPVDCFFLQIQGAGVIRLSPGGTLRRVGYAGSNGRPYHSIGKDLIESGAISREKMSLQAIRRYLYSHPESRDEIMWKNRSYVFFKWVSQGPIGSLGVKLTAGRSIATDPRFHPCGAPAFLVSEKPVYDSSGKMLGWERFGRWVFNQDTGGAIKGPGRIDLFCGTGKGAERIAGPMKQQGEIYYFIKKGLISPQMAAAPR